MNEALQKLEVKVENEGSTPQGRLSSAEWNIVVAALKAIDAGDGGVGKDAIIKAVCEAGYVTRSDVDTIFSEDAVRIATNQNILAIHTFKNGLKIQDVLISQSQSDTLFIDGNVVVRGGITVRGSNEITTPSLFDALPIDSRTIKRDENGMLYVDADALNISGGGGGSAEVTYDSVISALGYTPYSTAGGTINGEVTILGNATIAERLLVTNIYTVGKVYWHGDPANYYIACPADTSRGGAYLEYNAYAGHGFLGGNVAIGGNTASAKLHVYGSTGWASTFNNSKSEVSIGHSDGYGLIVMSTMPTTTTNGYLFRVWQGSLTGMQGTGTAVLDVKPNGNVAIGGTTASEKLHVYGNLLVAGGITAHYTSDERLKKNLRPIDAGQMILSLGRVREFEYIDSEIKKNSLYKGSHVGLIYQDVKTSALSKMCYEREDGYGSLDYLDTSLTALLVGVAQEHEIRLTHGERELVKVKRENEALKKRIEQLERVL